ncbi:UDP-forming cellulose synthase catalytic subunit [Affinibrenneria salicis]|uniref:Cellulose synthase catalytic subunit [UDP-forming] n=1 Tax=Affinibrenneria salicis TaxID=2590031 RepID=A0A5J5G1Y2_9GAMM|nr:UDP-forming cellulose synthase catalytic subunit [Affinibrenneria salicis]KAA9000697.1 UDP-forming cellulose synthase catalytic subunit [Affinibrenneria salicis]
MNPLRGLLCPPVQQALSVRYRRARRAGVCRATAAFCLLWVTLAWLFFRLEAPAWRRLLRQRRQLFPHIDPRRPRPLDIVRYLLQGLWLALFFPRRARPARYFPPRCVRRAGRRLFERGLARLSDKARTARRLETTLTDLPAGYRRLTLSIAAVGATALALICITQPFDIGAQTDFVALLLASALVLRLLPGRLPTLMLILLSLIVSSRYLWWRFSTTLSWDEPLSVTFGLLLIAAETYTWSVLVLGYFQTLWPLDRQPVTLPADTDAWPTVDLLIPTYNEPLNVVETTLYAALGIDWPRDKLTIYLLDDGDRPAFRAFAARLGIRYIARADHEHAKAGNINHALRTACRSAFVAIFDCDHVPTRTFLQTTMGWFLKEPRLGMLQTPHHFFSPDPFERNLGRFRRMPNEGMLFYGLVQNGNDVWNAAFFCGSCAVIRRTALDEIGGIAVETVTEDAHTSLRLHRRGYTSAYIRIPQAAGLATESLAAHIGQRIRWARGMVQIFRLDNPLLGKGLSLVQRLCYANAMLHFLSGIPRLIFLLAPLAFLLCHACIIFAPALAIALYALPHILHTSLTNSRIQGRYRHSFWSEIYETVLAWYIARPTAVALFNPHKGVFNVTAKGGLIEERHLDWSISRPYLLLVLFNLAGLATAIWRICYGPAHEMMTVALSLVWVLYNMVILGGALAVAVEARQQRESQRVDIALPAALARKNGHLLPCTLRDYANDGVGVTLRDEQQLQNGEAVVLVLHQGRQERYFPCEVCRSQGNAIGLRLHSLTTEQHIHFVQCTFARADTWALWQSSMPADRPLRSLADIARLSVGGYLRLVEYGPRRLRRLFFFLTMLIAWLASFLPRPVRVDAVVSRPRFNR